MFPWKGVLVALAVLAGTARARPAQRPVGATKTFGLRMTWQKRNPAGVSREMFLVNGKSPGPVLELDQDDWVVVHVYNESPFNTTLHFHGRSPPSALQYFL